MLRRLYRPRRIAATIPAVRSCRILHLDRTAINVSAKKPARAHPSISPSAALCAVPPAFFHAHEEFFEGPRDVGFHATVPY